ncbi:sulfur carrier protein [Thermotomaculum hydrothermale]|uniref:Sulfur carrier protein n=1 Tax=Thermotomaculum hydrothermale TaxID=981385 RepID=A0A7R6SYI5_9BACT|nr:sulfur carrier protein ThiS [Thermotomaculum hydrothermale]BBB32819.1 sulfur carrier protein [Thermotomaculum hydrothermale]
MKLRINGEIREFENNLTNVSELLSALKINSRFVAVELNGKVIYKEDFDKTLIKEGDKVEVVSFVGGG